MLDWVDVLRRLMMLYNVRTQAELSMAMGVEVKVGIDADIQKSGISWRILERAVKDKKVSWNWLMTGFEIMWDGVNPEKPTPYSTRMAAAAAAAEEARRKATRKPTRIETRELARKLLYRKPDDNGDAQEATETETATATATATTADGEACVNPATIVETLENVKAAMQKEIDRVERLLEDNR